LLDPVTQRITIEATGIFESGSNEAEIGTRPLDYLDSRWGGLVLLRPTLDKVDNPVLRPADRVAAVLGLNPRVRNNGRGHR
jgi:hypothetical protein